MFFKIVHTRNFLLYSLGQAISDLGSLMTYFALSLYVLKETNSATMFAFILSIKYIPQIILYPFAGVFIDRVSRKKVMIFFDGMRGIALSLVLLLVVWNGRLSFPLVYFIIILTAFSEVFYNLATNSIMPFLFKEDDLVLANSLSAWISNLSLILGPILGTFLYNKIGIVPILAIDTTTFFIVVGFTMFLKLIENERCLNRKTKVIQELKQGVKLITSNKDLMCATLGVGASRFFINPFYTIGMPVIIVSVLKAPEYAYGISQTFVMVGVLASPMLVMFLKKRHSDATSLFISRIGKVIPFSILLIVGFEGVRNALKSNIIFIIAFFSLICFFGMMFNSSGFAFLNTYFQKRVPREYLGRFASARFMFYSILEPLGMNCFGILYGRSNIKYALVLVLVGALTEATLLLRVREKEMNTKISAEALM